MVMRIGYGRPGWPSLRRDIAEVIEYGSVRPEPAPLVAERGA